MTDLAEQWVNIYKSKKHGSYWTGAFCYKTKEEAVKDLADREHYLTTVNIEDMLQKSENVAKNVTNENSQDLTEQWKKGRLPSGYYYIIPVGSYNHCYIDYYNAETDDWEVNYCNKIQTVIDQVPSYNSFNAFKDDFKYIKKLKKDSEKDNELYRAKIKQLKELLKECKMPLEVYNEMFGNKAELLTKIDEVLK